MSRAAPWVVAAAILSSAWCASAAFRLGATFDEPFYVREGLRFWRTGSHGMLVSKGTMPLVMDAATLPIHLWERARGRVVDPSAELPEVLPWVRVAALVFWWMLLLVLAREAMALGGTEAAVVAVTLLAVEPVLLGHAALATADVAVVAPLVGLAGAFRRGRDRDTFHRIGLPGAWFGLALVAKASALALGPVILLGIEAAGRATGDRQEILGRLRGFARDLSKIVGIALVITFVACGSDWQREGSFVAWARTLHPGPLRDVMRGLAEGLWIFPNAGNAIARQVRHNIAGHHGGAYLLGEVAAGFPLYFPIALALKLAPGLPLLALALAVLRPRSLLNPAAGLTALLLAASVGARVQIGVRYVLPLVAFAAIAVAVAFARARQGAGPAVRRALAAVAVTAVGWNALAAVRVWPQGIAYTNALCGGTEDGYRCLSDSNYDWGQGLPELAEWFEAAGGPPLAIWYFGTDPLLARLPFRSLPLHVFALADGAEVAHHARGHYLAASTTLLYGTRLTEAHRRAAEFLMRRTPVARTTTFLIYDFRGER